MIYRYRMILAAAIALLWLLGLVALLVAQLGPDLTMRLGLAGQMARYLGMPIGIGQ